MTEFALVTPANYFFRTLVSRLALTVVIAPSLPKNYGAGKSLEKSS